MPVIRIPVAVDPGHGVYGSGCSDNCVDESTYLRDLALLVEPELLRRGLGPVIVRREMAHVSFTERAAIARRSHARGVIVLHVNSDTHAETHGPMAFHLGDTRAIKACEHFLSQLNRSGEYVKPSGIIRPSRQLWNARDAITKWEHAYNTMFRHDEPVCMFEVGFASNQDEAAWMLSEDGKAALVEAIAGAALVMVS